MDDSTFLNIDILNDMLQELVSEILLRPQSGSKLMGFYFMMLKPRKFCLAWNNLQCIMNQMYFPQVLSNLALSLMMILLGPLILNTSQ